MTNDVRLRFYFGGLVLLVLSKTADAPIVDLVPALDTLARFTGWSLQTSAQVASLKWLAVAGLLFCVWVPRSSIARFVGLFFFSLFMLGLYSQVYSRQMDYIPHSENIHFFLLLALFIISLGSGDLEKRRIDHIFTFIIGWTYTAAFFTKIDNVGLEWATGETLPAYFATFGQFTDNANLFTLARSPVLAKIAGISTLVFELLALPLMLYSRTRKFAILAALLFHLSVWWLLGINFFVSYLIGFILIWKSREAT
jgi:hypothetical protein